MYRVSFSTELTSVIFISATPDPSLSNCWKYPVKSFHNLSVVLQFSANMLYTFRIASITIILTKHGFKLDQAADEVVKVNHLILCIPGYQNLVQSVVQFKTYTGSQ